MMRYAGGNNPNRPWNDVSNPLTLHRSQPWRVSPTRDFSGGTMEGLVSRTSQVSDYLSSSGYTQDIAYLQQRGYKDGPRQSWEDLYPNTSENKQDYFDISTEMNFDEQL